MRRVDAKFPELKLLANCKTKLRKAILLNSDTELVKVIRDCVYNVLKGNVKLKKGDSEKLNKYKSDLLKFVYERGSIAQKRKFLIQKGGFLPFLIPLAIDTTARLISFALDKFNK